MLIVYFLLIIFILNGLNLSNVNHRYGQWQNLFASFHPSLITAFKLEGNMSLVNYTKSKNYNYIVWGNTYYLRVQFRIKERNL